MEIYVMRTGLPTHLKSSGHVLCAACLFLFCLAFDVAHAESQWLDKATDLIKTYGQGTGQSNLTVGEISAGLKEALRLGSADVVNQLGRVNGFYNDSAVRIPLPEQFNAVKPVLDALGMSGLLENLELKLNRAAEVATPKAKDLFYQAISEMSIDDARTILNGPKDAATQYFRRKMGPSLAKEMKPLVESSLEQVEAVQVYDNIMEKYQSVPFVPDVKTNLTDYVVEKGMDGIFYYMAREEEAIRSNPAKRTTDLLKRVFGGT